MFKNWVFTGFQVTHLFSLATRSRVALPSPKTYLALDAQRNLDSSTSAKEVAILFRWPGKEEGHESAECDWTANLRALLIVYFDLDDLFVGCLGLLKSVFKRFVSDCLVCWWLVIFFLDSLCFCCGSQICSVKGLSNQGVQRKLKKWLNPFGPPSGASWKVTWFFCTVSRKVKGLFPMVVLP